MRVFYLYQYSVDFAALYRLIESAMLLGTEYVGFTKRYLL